MTAHIGSFEVEPPPAYASWLLVGLGGVLPLAAIGLALWSTRGAFAWLPLLPALLLLPVLLGLLLFALRRRSVQLRDGVLDVRAALFRRRVPVDGIDLARARIVDLEERTELRPLLKTNGMSLPGYHAGNFRLRGGFSRAFCLVTARKRVLWLPLRDGSSQLLLSLSQPQALLDALRHPPAR